MLLTRTTSFSSRNIVVFAFAFLLLHAGTASADFITGYTYGVAPSNSYPDSGHSTGGMGELTDTVSQTNVWGGSNSPSSSDIVPLVGFLDVDADIAFIFDGVRNVNSATIWFADSDGSAGVNMPTSVTIRNADSSFSHTESITNPAGSGDMVGVTLSGFEVAADSLIVESTRGGQWTMISEVSFTAVPEPSALLISVFGTMIGLSTRRRR